MAVTYFKRYRMQFDLREGYATPPPMPAGYQFVPWSHRILKNHAEAKFRSFRNELDSNVFPCLGDAEGCLRLMKEISCRNGFVPESTWLIQFHDEETGYTENCGTIQGIREQADVGSIQNVGIVPSHRGQGLGKTLLAQSLLGFEQTGIQFVTLEVTAQNSGALRLYRHMGFRTLRTVYKSVELSYA